jgi:hypothetical protein
MNHDRSGTERLTISAMVAEAAEKFSRAKSNAPGLPFRDDPIMRSISSHCSKSSFGGYFTRTIGARPRVPLPP